MHYVMYILFGAIPGFIPMLPVLVVYQLVMSKKNRDRHIKTAKAHFGAVYIFCLIILTILSVTGMPNIQRFTLGAHINLTLFIDFSFNSHQYALNILLFVPIGLFLPMLWKTFEKIYAACLCGVLFSLSIEIIQIFNDRITDINDLLMNTTGTIIGYLLFAAFKKKKRKIASLAVSFGNHLITEPYVCFLTAWLSMFFVQPFVADLLWDLTPIIR